MGIVRAIAVSGIDHSILLFYSAISRAHLHKEKLLAASLFIATLSSKPRVMVTQCIDVQWVIGSIVSTFRKVRITYICVPRHQLQNSATLS